MTDINFKGGFLINNPSKRIWVNIKSELPKKKCIFENFNKQEDKFFAIKSAYDKVIIDILLKKNIKFRFYPDINLKTRLDPENIEEAHRIINAQTNFIEEKEKLKQLSKSLEERNSFTTRKYRWKSEDHIEKTYKAIGISSSEYTTEIKSGITYIKDKQGKIVAKASPNNERGVNFVYVYPKNTDEPSKRFALSQDGEIEFFGPLSIIDFQKNFMKNVKIDLGRKRSNKQYLNPKFTP